MSTTKFKQNLNVAGNIYLSGNVVADGNVTLGDADTDSITLNADITSSIIPDATDTYDLGSTGKKWRNLDLSQNATIGGNVSAGDLTFSGTISSTAVGTPTITSATDILIQAGTGADDRVEISQAPLKLASITTVDRDAKTSQNGDMIYNSTTNQYEVYENGTWRSLGTDQDVADQVAALVDSAPSTLDTLNELAAALGDDPNFATTTATNLGLKLNTADFTSTANTWLATKSTTNVSEGTNLYYTDARARAAVSATTGSAGYNSSTGAFSIPANTSHVTESGNLYYTDARADARVNLQTGANLDLSSKSTTNLSEGTNLYYTDARADARIANNIIDEDNMTSDSATRAPSQQSVKAYVDTQVAGSGGGGGSFVSMGYASGGQASSSTLYRFSGAISLPAGHTITGWSSDQTNMAVSWRDNYQGATTILGTGSYTNSGGSAVNVYAWCNTSNSNARSVTYQIFG